MASIRYRHYRKTRVHRARRALNATHRECWTCDYKIVLCMYKYIVILIVLMTKGCACLIRVSSLERKFLVVIVQSCRIADIWSWAATSRHFAHLAE